jgi:cation transport ATPase
MTYNKDESGDFTDEAIEAVEKELSELAEKIQVDEGELGERIADATFRESYDFIEVELAVMRSVAVDMLNERVKQRIAQVRENKRVKKMLMSLSLICASLGLAALALSMFRGIPMSYLVTALVFIILFVALLLATINVQAIDEWLDREMDIDLELAMEINDSAKEMLISAKKKTDPEAE